MIAWKGAHDIVAEGVLHIVAEGAHDIIAEGAHDIIAEGAHDINAETVLHIVAKRSRPHQATDGWASVGPYKMVDLMSCGGGGGGLGCACAARQEETGSERDGSRPRHPCTPLCPSGDPASG